MEAIDNNRVEILKRKQTLPWNSNLKAEKTIINEFSFSSEMI